MRDELRLHAISKRYKKNKHDANHDISVTFYPGEVVAIIGHNGAGKSTLLNQIIGLTKPTEGIITYGGYSFVQEKKKALKFATMMPQFQAPLTGVTMREAIASILRIRGLGHSEVKLHTDAILKELKLLEWSDSQGQKLSGGLQRLTSFAMTVAAPPPIILLDEPTNDVDPVRRKILWQHLRKLANQGHIIIVVTHNLLEVEQYTDRYLLLDKGELLKDVSIKDISPVDKLSMLLTVFAGPTFTMPTFPIIKIVHHREENRYDFEIKQAYVVEMVEWVLGKMATGEVINYKLSPLSLHDIYGGLVDES
jgi:ABC-2 type transport system ATP-binding protein